MILLLYTKVLLVILCKVLFKVVLMEIPIYSEILSVYSIMELITSEV